MSVAKEFIASFSEVQPLPHVISSLTTLMADNDSTMKDFEEIIMVDPILVSRLLRFINSPYYGLNQPVTSISRAVAYLGMKNLHNLVVVDALKALFESRAEHPSFSKKNLWLHCAAVSICSKMISERIFGINGDDAFLCGILHDFGLLVEEQVAASKFYDICSTATTTDDLVRFERERLGTDHGEIGYQLAQEWNMSQIIREAIRDHHLISDSIVPENLTGIIQIAEFIAFRLDHNNLPQISCQISPKLMEHLQDNMDEYTVLVEDFPDEMEKAQAIYG